MQSKAATKVNAEMQSEGGQCEDAGIGTCLFESNVTVTVQNCDGTRQIERALAGHAAITAFGIRVAGSKSQNNRFGLFM